jgi:uncharacterized membrane protein YGL010W
VTDIDNWLTRYEQTHQGLHNPIVYWAAVPMVVVGMTGLLWALPVPGEFLKISPLLNWGSAFLMVTAIYYFIISLSLAIGLLPFLLGLASIQMWLIHSGFPAIAVSAGLLVAGIVGLGLGRRGGLRLVLQDLQLMMIGPAWLLSVLYKRFGIPI